MNRTDRILYLNALLLLLISGATALVVSDIASHGLSRLFPKSVPKATAASSASAASENLMSYAPVLEKGYFGKAAQGKLTEIAAAQQGAPAGAAAPTTSQGDLFLLGTAVGSFRETFALVRKNSTNEERVFRLGDRVFDIGPLVSVKKEVAEILSGGRKVKILAPTAAGDAPPPAGQPGGLAVQSGAGSYVVDQRALNAALDNIGQAMTDARLLPSMKDGKVEGFRLSEVKPSGIFGMIGLKNGDVLQRLNDFAIDSPEKAMQSFMSLKGQSHLKLDLVRDGQTATLNYDIR